MNRSIVATAALAALVLSLPASAQFQKPEDAVKYGQSSMFLMASHFGRIGQSTFVMRNPPHDAGLLGRIIGTKPAVALLGVKLQLAPAEGGVAGVVVLSLEAAAGSPTAMLLAETLERAAASVRGGALRVELDLARPVGAQDGAHG